MKTLTIVLLLLTATCRAQDANGITRKSRRAQGESFVWSFFREDQRVMVEYSRPNTNGLWSVTRRAYFIGGKTAAIESDEDRDRFFESLIVYRSDTGEIDYFTRSAADAGTSFLGACCRSRLAVI